MNSLPNPNTELVERPQSHSFTAECDSSLREANDRAESQNRRQADRNRRLFLRVPLHAFLLFNLVSSGRLALRRAVDVRHLTLVSVRRFVSVWRPKSVSQSDVKQTVCFDAETLVWGSVAYNRVFPGFRTQNLLIAH
jgi:hypothetical protein